jgi:hypothetical protein
MSEQTSRQHQLQPLSSILQDFFHVPDLWRLDRRCSAIPEAIPTPRSTMLKPARKSRQPRPKPLCRRRAAASFEIDRTIDNDIIEVKYLVPHTCLSYMQSIQPSMAAGGLKSQQRVSSNTRRTWPHPALRLFDLSAAYHRDPYSNTHESVHSQAAKKSRSRWW